MSTATTNTTEVTEKQQISLKIPKVITKGFVNRLIKKYGSPLMIIQKDQLTKQYKRFKTQLPFVDPFYAVKCNPNPEIIQHFADLGSSFDVASAREISWCLAAGVSPDRLIFANTIKSVADLAYAREHGVDLMTYDNESELYKIAEHCPGARVVLRIKVQNVGSVVQLSLKFGADPEQALFLLKKAKKLGLKPEGISFHVGSQCTNIDNYVKSLEVASSIFNQAEYNDIKLNMLDIGGGFPIKYFESDDAATFEEMASMLKKEIKRLFKDYYKNIRIIAEPGRFFAGPSGFLITQVVGRAYRDNKNYYYLNDGVYQDFSGIIFDHAQYEFHAVKKGKNYISTLAGPTCDSLDVISLTEELPELEMDDVIYVKNIGAYSCASAVPAFNGFSPARILFV